MLKRLALLTGLSPAGAGIGLGVSIFVLLAIGGLIAGLSVTRARLSAERAFTSLVIDATRAAATQPALRREDVPAQIAAFGRSIGRLQDGLNRCNATAHAAEANDLQRQSVAVAQLAAANARTSARQSVIDRLRASAAAPRPAGGACEPSETVREIWP